MNNILAVAKKDAASHPQEGRVCRLLDNLWERENAG